MTTERRNFRQRFLDREHLVGTFVKTPATHPIEILGAVGFDFVVIDEEHAPWDRVAIDGGLLAARASGTAGLVRVAEPTAAKILSVLDDGATGVLVPHVSSPAKARDIAAACRYRGGRRGFSNTTRAGSFGAVGIWDHVQAGDEAVTFIAMIEDPEALEDLDGILGAEGLDGVFIGRGDLTVAFGATGMDGPQVRDACDRIFAAAKRAGKPVAVMVASAEEAARFRGMGASAFIVASDQGFMRQAAMKAYGDIASVANG
ncbi:aldolase [Mesorhizobium tianshanense]|uniref:2-keto-3-deoxy-L-rhamnonate aldolase RhmA n=1 Tax=Mesorhizobium tianshanense TaxID=39844 RepID=A0A562N6X3_9HYPH|nr:aldolase/citrate lyase family protein [Mesorhizobium tianshanense]TWI27905.1 2-keto-3-deoxy-L-rhamnonate aldolase RhmA [Mesorhizobium tianshanense]GLS39982.1 aldolase [Mesorhizobium tianshanense]